MNNLSYKKSVLKEIKKLPNNDRQVIVEFLENLQVVPNPKSLPNCKKLKQHTDYFRYRIGVYRIITHITENNIIDILVLTIGHRKDIYQKLKTL